MHDSQATIPTSHDRARTPERPDRSRLTLAVATVLAATALLAPAPTAAQLPCGAGYTVRTGDSLLEIAQRCGITIPALLAANPGVRDRMDLEVGDRLRIPAPGDPQPSPQQACGPYYTVRTGDTLAEIAEKCGLTIPLLVAANGPLPDPLGVHDGMRIQIPDVPERAVRDASTLAFPPGGMGVAAGEAGAGAAVEVEAEAEAEAEASADAEAAAAEDAAQAADARELTRVEGTLVAGDPCLLIRAADGDAFALVGRVSDAFRPGDRVVVMGVPAEDGSCGAGPALEVRIVYRGQKD